MKKKDKHTGFSLPENYFEGFTDRLLNKISESPSSAIPEKDGFLLPDLYFENFSVDLEKIHSQEEKGKRILFKPNGWWLAAAAVFVLGIFIANPWKSEEILDFDDLAGTEIQEYLESENNDFSAYEMAELLPVEHISIIDFLEDSPAEEHILEYLDENTDRIEELYIENNE